VADETFSFGANAEPSANGQAEAGGAPAGPAAPDLYDPAALGLSQDFEASFGAAPKIDTIKVEKPSKERVFRTHPDPAYWLKTTLLVTKDDSKVYLVVAKVRGALADEPLLGVYTLVPYVTRFGNVFLWPIKMAGADGDWNSWHESAWRIARDARTSWARVRANREGGCYVPTYDPKPPDQQQAARWPELEFRDLLRVAFRGCTIDSVDHPVVKRLRLED
jgi:hypothetical protein